MSIFRSLSGIFGRLSAGEKGEQVASRFLERAGHRILARNYRVRSGEIDIISELPGLIVFTEVKTASADTPGDPLLRVTPKKIQRIKRAAGHYLRSSAGKTDALKRQPRYDIITVRTNADGKSTVQHYPNAIRFD